MPKDRTVEVDDVKDFKDLFDLLCDEVMNLTPMDVRKNLLNFRGTDTAINNNTIRANDIFKIIDQKGIKFNLKLDYTSSVVIKSVPAAMPPTPKVVDVYKQMNAQSQEIPDYLMPAPEVKIEEEKPFRPPAMDIPDFE